MTALDGYESWVAHEHPGRRLDSDAYICHCEPCLVALRAAAVEQPEMEILVRRSFGRNVVHPADLLTAEGACACESLLGGTGDYVRDIQVVNRDLWGT